MKTQGPIWLGLSDRVTSLRAYETFDDIRRMVARSAYAQLRYSPILLAGTVIAMLVIYVAPPALAVPAGYPANVLALAAYLLMSLAYQPTLRFTTVRHLGLCATTYRDRLCGFHARFSVSAWTWSGRSLERPRSGRSRTAMTVDTTYKSGKSEGDENFPRRLAYRRLAPSRAHSGVLSFRARRRRCRRSSDA